MSRSSPGSNTPLPKTRPRFADWLAKNRKSRGLTQDDLADLSGVDQGLISKYERGVMVPPKGDTVERLAHALSSEQADEHTARALLNAGLKAAGFAPVEADDPNPEASTYELTRSIIRQKGFDEQEFSGQEVDQIQSGVEALIEGYLFRKRQDRGEAD